MKRVTFMLDPDPDWSWLEQDHYRPGHPEFSPIFASVRDMRRWQRAKATNPDVNPRDFGAIDPDDYTDPRNHVAILMIVESYNPQTDDWSPVDSLGGIDFFPMLDRRDHGTGTFDYVSDMPKGWRYLRQLARESGVGYRRRAKGRG